MDMFTTMITPYKKDGTVDLEAVEKYVDWYFENGLGGIFAVCQSSEIFYLTLEEKVAINRTVYQRAKALEKKHGRPFTVVSSGHTSFAIKDQARELCAVAESGTDALILITNRLDPNNEGDDAFIKNAEELLTLLPKDVKLGLYECPYPYKRLVTPRILEWCVSTGRFAYMKDTCCDAALIAERCRILKGSGFKLLNANGQTLLESMRSGADGYCGIMCNFHPYLYAWLGEHYADDPRADLIQANLCAFSFIEFLPYPLSAKYNMNLCGIPTEITSRTGNAYTLTDYAKSCVEQFKIASDYLEASLKA